MRDRAAKKTLKNAIGMKNIYRHLYQDIYGFPSSAISFISASKESLAKESLASLLTGYLKLKFKNISSNSPAYLSTLPPHPNIHTYIYRERDR